MVDTKDSRNADKPNGALKLVVVYISMRRRMICKEKNGIPNKVIQLAVNFKLFIMRCNTFVVACVIRNMDREIDVIRNVVVTTDHKVDFNTAEGYRTVQVTIIEDLKDRPHLTLASIINIIPLKS